MLTGTKKTLVDLIKHNGILSMDQIVERTDLSKTTIREHLLQLERDGDIEREYVRSGPGRPSLKYRLTPRADRYFPSSELALFRRLIKYLKAEGHEETIRNFFETFWEERLQKAQSRMDAVSIENSQARLTELKAFLAEEGFMPELEYHDDLNSYRIKECNCPFKEVVKETRLPCRLEGEFFQKLLHPEAERTEYLPDGDFSCTYHIPIQQDE